MKSFEEMSKSELENESARLKDLLEEVIEEKSMILGQENHHVSSKLVSKCAAKYAKEIEEINADIALVVKLMQDK